MSDHQRQRVYKAEHSIDSMGVPMPTIDHARALVKVIERLPWYPPRCKGLMVSTTFQSRKAFYSEGCVHLPAIGVPGWEWAYTDLVIAHEVAHHLDPSRSHGPVFTSYLLRILDGIGRTATATALRQAYIDNGVDVYERKESA